MPGYLLWVTVIVNPISLVGEVDSINPSRALVTLFGVDVFFSLFSVLCQLLTISMSKMISPGLLKKFLKWVNEDVSI